MYFCLCVNNSIVPTHSNKQQQQAAGSKNRIIDPDEKKKFQQFIVPVNEPINEQYIKNVMDYKYFKRKILFVHIIYCTI